MSVRNPSSVWRKVIVGGLYGSLGVLAGMMLGLIPERIVVLMIVGGLIGAWVGSRQEADSQLPSHVTGAGSPD